MGHAVRTVSGLIVTATTTAALLAGGGTAFADGSGEPRGASAVCAKRIPAVLDRIDRLTDRIGDDAGTRGSTAWLASRADRARDAGLVALADLLEVRVAGRGERLAELAELRGDVQDVRAKDCG